MHQFNSFVTLTYDDDHYDPSLNYLDFQRFMYRVRAKLGPTRFFMCGEYGDITRRPHFHCLLFGRTFFDGIPCGKDLFSSNALSNLWRFGFSSYGSVTYQSASYVAGYCCKKALGNYIPNSSVDIRTGEIVPVVPEFGHMSLKPGIGASWFNKFWREVYLARNGVVLKGGTTVPAPRYYDKLILDLDYDLAEYRFYERYVNAVRFLEDCSPDRLLVRESCAKAKINFKRKFL